MTAAKEDVLLQGLLMTRDEAITWVAELIDEDPNSLNERTSRDQVPAWDSLGVLTLMAGFDEKFGIVLEDEDMQHMKTVNDILMVLKKNGKLND